MAQPSYIPTVLADLNNWVTNFNTLILADPTLYGLLAADATTIDLYCSAWLTAYPTSVDPLTRTKTSVQARVDAQAAMLGIVRPYAQSIRNNAGVSNDNKVALGLTIPITTRTPIPVPETQPILAIIAATPGQFTMRYADPLRPETSRAKPFGARQVQLAAAYGTAPVSDPALASVIAEVTTQPYFVDHLFSNNGKICTLFARWVGRRPLFPGGVGYGPWSLPVSMTVSF